MGILIFWAGTLFGVFLGIVLISLLSMAQKADEFSDLISHGGEIATPEDTYRLPSSETLLPTGSGEARPRRDRVDCGLRVAN